MVDSSRLSVISSGKAVATDFEVVRPGSGCGLFNEGVVFKCRCDLLNVGVVLFA